jgi:hypothetical protein
VECPTDVKESSELFSTQPKETDIKIAYNLPGQIAKNETKYRR